MTTAEGTEIYKERASTAETVNADVTEKHGLRRVPVRGTDKVLSVALLCALTCNVVHALSMGALAAERRDWRPSEATPFA